MIGEWLTTAWEAYKRNWLNIVGTVIAVYVISAVVTGIVALVTMGSAILSAMQGGAPNVFHVGAGLVATAIVYFLTSVWAGAALLVAYRDALSGTAHIGKALSEGIQYYGRMLAVTLITFLATGILVGVGLYTLIALKAAGLALAVILWLAALVVYLLLLWAPAYVVVENMSALDALRKSWEHTKDKIGTLLWFVLTTIILGIVGSIVSIIPVIGTIATVLVIAPLIGMVYIQAAQG